MFYIFDAIVNGFGTLWDFKEMENFSSLSVTSSPDNSSIKIVWGGKLFKYSRC